MGRRQRVAWLGNATGRTLAFLANLTRPPLPQLDAWLAAVLSNTRPAVALELGCGEGAALHDLRLRHPHVRGMCLSSMAWDLRCNASARRRTRCFTGSPRGGRLVHLVPPEDVIYGDYSRGSLPGRSGSYDVVFSQGALGDAGKLPSPGRIVSLAMQVASRLKTCGVAALQLFGASCLEAAHLTWGADPLWPQPRRVPHTQREPCASPQVGFESQARIVDAVRADVDGDEEAKYALEVVLATTPMYPVALQDEPPMPYSTVLYMRKLPLADAKPTCSRKTAILPDGPEHRFRPLKWRGGVQQAAPSITTHARGARSSRSHFLMQYLGALHGWLHA